jgi:serine/threonine protein kinase
MVYLAEREHDGLRVALKVLDKRLRADPIFRERFVREYKLLSSLNNEHVAPHLRPGLRRRPAYIAMEFLPSGTLASRIHEGISTRAALRLTLQIARALDAIHTGGHRAPRPEAVQHPVPRRRPAGDRDFGLARTSVTRPSPSPASCSPRRAT